MSNETPTDATPTDSQAPATTTPAAPADGAAAQGTGVTPAAAPADGGTLLGGQPPADGKPATPAVPADQAPEDGKPADGKPTEPVSYDDLQAPEGTTFNAQALGDFKALAKDMGLSKDNAQKLANLGVQAVQAHQAEMAEAIQQEQAKWEATSRADKEFGGDKLDESLSLANHALATFATPEMLTLLKESKLGNHPEFIRTFVRVGRAISEDSLVKGTTKPAVKDARNFYPNSHHSA